MDLSWPIDLSIPMQTGESQRFQKFRNSFRLTQKTKGSKPNANGIKQNGSLSKSPEWDNQLSRAERERRMQQIEELAREKTPNPGHLIHLLREKECEIQAMNEDLENLVFERRELQEALTEAQTIIDQQQDQLSEFRRQAAQSRTDAEAFKMKNIFLSEGASTRDEQVNALSTACDRLEAEVEALTWQLDQNRRSLNQVQNQRDHLQKQLDEALQWHETLLTDQATTSMSELHVSTGMDGPVSIKVKSDDACDDVAADPFAKRVEQNHLSQSTPAQGPHENQQAQKRENRQQQQTAASQTENERVISIENQVMVQEIEDLRGQLAELREREREWAKTESRLLDQQQQLEEERQQHLTRIEMLMHTQRSSTTPESDGTLNQRPSSATLPQSDLGQAIELQQMKDERTRWRLYACSLVRTFVDYCEEFIRRTDYDEPEFHTIAERRWYDYAIYLLEILIDEAPQRLSESDAEMIRRNRSSQQNTISQRDTMLSTISTGPELLSAVALRRKEKHSTQERAAKLAKKPLFRRSRNN